MLDEKLRRAGIIVLFIAGILLLLIMYQFQAERTLTAAVSDLSRRPAYDELRFVRSSTVAGLRQEGTKLRIDRFAPGSDDVREWVKGLGAEAAGAQLHFSTKLEHAAWIKSGEVWAEALIDAGEPFRIGTDGGSALLEVGFLRDDILGVLYSDGKFEQWNCVSNSLVNRTKLGMREISQAGIVEGYVAAASGRENRILLYHALDANDVRVVEQFRFPPGRFELVAIGAAVALLTENEILYRGKVLGTPGRVRSLAFGPDGELLGAGEFEGVWMFADGKKPIVITHEISGGVLAANGAYLVHSANSGITALKFGEERQPTPMGKRSIYLAVSFLIGGLLLLGDGFVVGLRRRVNRDSRQMAAGSAELRFPNPPAELVRALGAGECVLWAGSGLSAQSGLSTRQAFVQQLIEAAQFEHWLAGKQGQKLIRMCISGKHEEALDELAASRGVESRGDVFAHLRQRYQRTAGLSRTHERLAELPFIGGVTTNYDDLIEKMGESWQAGVLHTKSVTRPNVQDRFLFKLYGDMEDTKSVLLTRSELTAAIRGRDPLAQAIRYLFEHNTLFFIGCSLDSLAADLRALVPIRSPKRKHFALAVVDDRSWSRRASELQSRWGIEVLPCRSDEIQIAMPEFMDLLTRKVREIEDLPAMLSHIDGRF